jgi:glycosyltransferase involved in cell wall biosynthesis
MESPTKQKVLLVITKSNFGGAQRYVFDLATNLPKDRFEVKVAFGQSGRLKDELEKAGIETIQIDGLERDINLFAEIKVFRSLYTLFKKEKPDVVHLNSSKIGGLGALAGRLARIPKIIFTGHGWAFNEDRSWLSKKIILFLHWITILLAHTTIAVSNKTAQDVTWLPFVKNKIVTIYNGVLPCTFLSKAAARHHLLPSLQDSIWIGTLAELHPTKGLLYAIEAMRSVVKEFPNAHYVILGEGEQRKTLEEKITALDLNNNIHLLGYINNAKEYLQAFDIFLLPSISEALPYTIVEAGFAQLPIIATNVGGIPEIITHENTGLLIPSKNPTAIDKAIRHLLSDYAEKSQLAQNAHKEIIGKFTIEKMISDLIKLYTYFH